MKKLSFMILLFFLCIANIFPLYKTVYAQGLSQDDLKAIYGDSTFYDPNYKPTECNNSLGGDIQSFMRSPIDSDWGISDATIEEWFLKQAGARKVINKYGINASNINEISTAVKNAGVSAVFFYVYTISEGSGAGGFINHFGSDTSGGGTGNATRDAKYLKETSNKTGLNPSWIDAGSPVDFVPQDVKNKGNSDFQSIPLNTIGKAYIPATAAATWEVYYPIGLKKDFNKVQDYGSPLSTMISSIKKIGGDPLQGDIASTDDCQNNNTVTGEGMEKAVNWAKTIAANNGYGYDQPTRASGWQKWQTDPNCIDQCGSFDCSSFVASALTIGGYYTKNPLFNTGNEAASLQSIGFIKIADSGPPSENLKPGDILIKDGHTAMYIGNNQIVHASINENGGTSGGQVGDQKGNEITVGNYNSNGWNEGVWRAPN